MCIWGGGGRDGRAGCVILGNTREKGVKLLLFLVYESIFGLQWSVLKELESLDLCGICGGDGEF